MKMPGKRKFGRGEAIPDGYCPHGCGNKKKGRSALYTCGSRKCVAAEQAKALDDPYTDNRDPATGMKVKHAGQTYNVKRSTGSGDNIAYVTKQGITLRAKDCKVIS